MSCEQQVSGTGRDSVEGSAGRRLFDFSDTAWLVGQAIRYLNTADKEGELAYLRTIELLRQNGPKLQETVTAIYRLGKLGDSSLRWNLLYVLGDAGDHTAAEFLVRTALERLPEANLNEGSEGPREMETLVCTMAVHALHRISIRHSGVTDAIPKIIAEHPARPILVEAVKVAIELGLKEKVRGLLPKEEHWILDIRRARTEEVFAEPERQDGKERGFTPPKTGLLYTAPQASCCTKKG